MCQGVLPFTLVFLSSFALLFINGRLVTSKMAAPSFASGVSPIVIPTYHPVIPTEETPPDPTPRNATESVPPFSVIIVTHNEQLLTKTLLSSF